MHFFKQMRDDSIMSLAKVLIVEDDSFIRATLSALLTQKGFGVIGAVDNAEEAVLLQEVHNPDVLLVDLDLGPGPNGIDIAAALRARNPQLGVIILTSFSDPRLADSRSQALPRGTMYFTKSRLNDVSILFTAILRAKHLPLAETRRSDAQRIDLTEAQIEILRLVSEGRTTASIAQERSVSEKSVEAMLGRIHVALGLSRDKSLNPRVQLTRAFLGLTGKNSASEQ